MDGRDSVLATPASLGWLCWLAAAGCTGPRTILPQQASPPSQAIFYRPREIGSESLFDPLSSSLQYVLDSAQARGFGTDDYSAHLQTVLDHLGDPIHTIERDKGWRYWVNKEIHPIDPQHIGDSVAILPNVFLHTLGGGLLYRKDAEWFEAHGFPAPYTTSGVLAMIAEVLGEAVEKPSTEDTDEIADVYIYRPLGIWLYSDDERARWIRKNLDPVAWPYLLMWDVDDHELSNTGMSYVIRPSWFSTPTTRFFSYLGMTNLFGLSHRVAEEDCLSWGIGAATAKVTVDAVYFRGSAGVFYDRDGSLLASMIFNGSDRLAVRANVYPGVLFDRCRELGVFLGLEDGGDVTLGLEWRLPIGLAR